jgi:hypothetical protein
MRLTPPPAALKGVLGEIVLSTSLPYSARVIAIWLILHHEDITTVTARVVERALWMSFATAVNSLLRLEQSGIVTAGPDHSYSLAGNLRAKAAAEVSS